MFYHQCRISPPTTAMPARKATPTLLEYNPPTPTPSVGNPPTHGGPDTPLAPNPPSPRQEANPSGATSTSFSLMVFLACGLLPSLQLAKSI